MLQAFLIGLINLKKVSLGLRRNLQGKDKVLEDRDRFATDLIGKSIFNCHNENLKKIILYGI
jgi:hypothetical protein